MMHRFLRIFGRPDVWLVVLASALSLYCEPPSRQDPASGDVQTPVVGVIGDSNSDEYRADDNRGAEQWKASTLNWVELLAKYRGVDFGEWGTWGEPRRTGFEYNWARSGGTARTIHGDRQIQGLAAQIAAGEVTHAVIWVGINDFRPSPGKYPAIYSGELSGQALQDKVDNIVADISNGVTTLLDAGAVKIILVGVEYVPARGRTLPAFDQIYPDPEGRQRVVDAVLKVNEGYEAIADAHPEVVYLPPIRDFFDPFARADQNGFIEFGGTSIQTMKYSEDPRALQLKDSHFSTVLNGIVANYIFIEPMNESFGFKYEPFSEEEIMAIALGNRP